MPIEVKKTRQCHIFDFCQNYTHKVWCLHVSSSNLISATQNPVPARLRFFNLIVNFIHYSCIIQLWQD